MFALAHIAPACGRRNGQDRPLQSVGEIVGVTPDLIRGRNDDAHAARRAPLRRRARCPHRATRPHSAIPFRGTRRGGPAWPPAPRCEGGTVKTVPYGP